MIRSVFGSEITDPSFLHKPESKKRRTTVMVSLSDVTISPVDLQNLLEVGMNAVKIISSHTTLGNRMRLLAKLDKGCMKCCEKYGVPDWPVATSIDLKTCIVKTGLLESDHDSIPINEGSNVILTSNKVNYNTCNEKKIFVDNDCLTTEVQVGTEISIGEDEIILQCTDIIDNKAIKCTVLKGGQLFDLDYVSMRGVKRVRPTLGKIDFKIIKFALEYQVDMLIINYVSNAETLKSIKKFIGNKVKRPYLISGICTQQGLDNIDDIAEESDAILLSREFLPFELDVSQRLRLYRIQKWIGGKCQALGKPFFLSGDVLEDSLAAGVYTDREVSDITNALLDGVSGFILRASIETAYVLETIRTLNKICKSVEPYTVSKAGFYRVIDEIKMPLNAAEASMLACVSAAYQCKAAAIVIPTVTGGTVRALLRMNPGCLVLTVSTHTRVNRLLKSCKNVVPLTYQGPSVRNFQLYVESKIVFAIDFAVNKRWVEYKDMYVTLQRGTEDSFFCDTVRVWSVTNYKRPLVECLDADEEYIRKPETITSATIVN